MNFIKNFLIFLVIFLIAGCAIHYASFRSFGVLIWSLGKDPESGKSSIVRTAIPGRPKVATTPTDDESGGKEKVEDEVPKGDPNKVVLFNGKDLGKWDRTEFGGEAEVFVNEDGALEFGTGAIMTGVHWTEDPPARTNYELTLEAQRIDGNDFFLALTFPVNEDYASFIVGGWGGGIVGISSIDDLDASENETMNIEGFENGVWYKIKIRVTEEKLEAWMDDRQMVDIELEDRKISLRPGDVELCIPLGIANFVTRSQYRNIEWKNVDPSKTEEINEPEPQVQPESQNPSAAPEPATAPDEKGPNK